MDADFASLEAKVAQFVSLCERLRAENTDLRQQLVAAQSDAKRLNERLDDPSKNWKFELGDLKERGVWDEYTAAYEEMLERCSTADAPWYLVPADKNKPRDFLVAELVIEALEAMDPKYPEADPEVLALRGKLT